METFIEQLVNAATNVISDFGFIAGFILIVLESIVPILPLAVFIGLNVISFGAFWGFILSWISTVIGCMLSFYICRKLSNKFDKKYKENKTVNKFRKYIDKLSFSNLVILLAVPFTPAFAINIGAGLSKIDVKRYFVAVTIGKISIVYFWGFIGRSFMESLKDPYVLAQIIAMLILAFLVSKVVNKFIK